MRRPTRTLFTLLLALSLLGGWSVPAAQACGAPCCAAAASPSRALEYGGQSAAVSGGCCCGNAAVPCKLEQGELPEGPPRALNAASRIHPPATGPFAVIQPGSGSVNGVAGLRRCGVDPPDRSPPDPLYLHHLSLLC